VRGITTDLDVNQAIKKAINDDATLSKLLVAEDGPANTLVITSLIDGAPVTAADLGFTLTAATNLTAGELSQLDAWYGLTAGSTTLLTQATTAGTFGALGSYNKELALDNSAAAIAGDSSTHTADNTITGGLGNDVLVLGTGADSNDTLVYQAGQFGNDKIVNFTVTGSANSDLLDFTAWLNNTTQTAPGLEVRVATAVNADGNLTANEVAIVDLTTFAVGTATTTFANMTDAQVLAAVNVAYDVANTGGLVGGVQHSLVFIENSANAGEYKVYEVTSSNTAGSDFTAATLVGSLDFGVDTNLTTPDFV